MKAVNTGPSGFNEAEYLEANPDVATAVRDGAFPNGWSHYVAHGYHEDRSGISPEVHEAMQETLNYRSSEPAPPEHLRLRVHGDTELDQFENAGKLVSLDIHSALDSLLTLTDAHRVLDFGCGSGRVLRYFHRTANASQLFGTDIDPEAVAWCQENLSHLATFKTNEPLPPLPFADDSFDVVYSISVFTHLSEVMQDHWLAELQRVTKPGAYLLLTTHSDELLQSASAKVQKECREKGFYFDEVGSGTKGLPDFYQTSFHSHAYIRQHWASYFEVLDIIDKGVMAHQDLVICQTPDPRSTP